MKSLTLNGNCTKRRKSRERLQYATFLFSQKIKKMFEKNTDQAIIMIEANLIEILKSENENYY